MHERKRHEELAKIQADADAAERARGGLRNAQLAAVQRQLQEENPAGFRSAAAATQQKPRPEYRRPVA